VDVQHMDRRQLQFLQLRHVWPAQARVLHAHYPLEPFLACRCARALYRTSMAPGSMGATVGATGQRYPAPSILPGCT